MNIAVSFLVLLVVSLLWPDNLFAWGPATHLKLGLSLLDNLKVLPIDIASLISNNAPRFLYGCVSADIIQAKSFLRYIEHCHNWANAFKLLRSAKSAPLKSFAMGYLSHLAADVVAHNCYIPAKMIETYSKKGLKHFVWEMRFDSEMNDEKVAGVLKDIIRMDHSEEDDLMNELLDTVLFSFKTNKRIFSGLLLIQRVKRWQETMGEVYLKNNYELTGDEVEHYSKLSLDAMIGFMIDTKNSKYLHFDPTGKLSLARAVKIMRDLNRKQRRGEMIFADNRMIFENIHYFREEFLK